MKVVNPSFIDSGAVVLSVPPTSVLRPTEVEEDPVSFSQESGDGEEEERFF